jgi:hypothetical protein
MLSPQVSAEKVERLRTQLSELCNVTHIDNCASVSLVGRNVRATLWKLAPAMLAFRQSKVHIDAHRIAILAQPALSLTRNAMSDSRCRRH